MERPLRETGLINKGKNRQYLTNHYEKAGSYQVAEGVGFEPTTPISQGNRLAGGRTRPLCDPSIGEKDSFTATYYSISGLKYTAV